MRMSIKMKKGLEELKETELKLRKLVHHKTCKDTTSCPRSSFHEKCSSGLNLITACAWQAAEYIGFFLLNIKYKVPPEKYLIKIQDLKQLLGYHADDLKIRPTYNLVSATYYLMDDINLDILVKESKKK